MKDFPISLAAVSYSDSAHEFFIEWNPKFVDSDTESRLKMMRGLIKKAKKIKPDATSADTEKSLLSVALLITFLEILMPWSSTATRDELVPMSREVSSIPDPELINKFFSSDK